MRAKMVPFLFMIAAFLLVGCESDETPSAPSEPIKPSTFDISPAPPPPTVPTSVPVKIPTLDSVLTQEAPDLDSVIAKKAPDLDSVIAQEAPDGSSIHILNRKENSDIVATLPIYQSGDVRYFAAGVGQLERMAAYPQFPIKLNFRGSEGALAFVAVTIWDQNETQVWQIPASHVKGPWVFIDLQEGTYRIDAVNGAETKSYAKVKVQTAKQQTVFFIWP